MKTKTYTYNVTDELVRLVGFDAAVLACRLPAFEEDGQILVSFAFLAELWDVDKRTIQAAAKKLAEADIFHYNTGKWKGSPTEWLKGTKFDTFIHSQRVQNLHVKGTKNVPNNKDTIKKDKIISAPTRVSNQSKIMEEFEQFWQAFFFGSYAKHEAEQMTYKERAANVWETLQADKRAALLRDIRAGKRYDKTHFVLWYIQHYEPGVKKGTRLTREQYYLKFGDDAVREGWRFYRPEGYERFIFEKL